MQMTIGEAVSKINRMQTIVREIESGGSVDHCLVEIADLLDEYITVISNTKVNV